MARFKANFPNRTVTVHKYSCRDEHRTTFDECGCSSQSSLERSRWFCEQHISISFVNQFMRDKFWSILPCEHCFDGLERLLIPDNYENVSVADHSTVGKHQVIVRLLAEGGVATILGSVDSAGWIFWSQGGTIDDEAKGDFREWTTHTIRDLGKLLPNDWPLYFPEVIHPVFVGWFQERYDDAMKRLSPELHEFQGKWAGAQWRRIFVSSIKH